MASGKEDLLLGYIYPDNNAIGFGGIDPISPAHLIPALPPDHEIVKQIAEYFCGPGSLSEPCLFHLGQAKIILKMTKQYYKIGDSQ